MKDGGPRKGSPFFFCPQPRQSRYEAAMTKRKRALRREADRTVEKLRRDLDKIADHAPGGSPERAIFVGSASEVEVTAMTMKCPLCQGPFLIEEHAAETIRGLRVRVVKAVCRACRAPRSVYFRLPEASLN